MQGNATDFGDLAVQSEMEYCMVCINQDSWILLVDFLICFNDNIDFIAQFHQQEITTDFGNLTTQNIYQQWRFMGNQTRGLICGGLPTSDSSFEM